MDLYKEYLDHYEITTEQIQAHLNVKLRPVTDLSGIKEFVEALMDMQHKKDYHPFRLRPRRYLCWYYLVCNLKIF